MDFYSTERKVQKQRNIFVDSVFKKSSALSGMCVVVYRSSSRCVLSPSSPRKHRNVCGENKKRPELSGKSPRLRLDEVKQG